MLKVTRNETHAAQRLEQRYGMQLSDELKHRIVREIRRAVRAYRRMDRDRRRRDTPLEAYSMAAMQIGWRDASGRERWRVQIDDTWFFVVYDPDDKLIVTFLPPSS